MERRRRKKSVSPLASYRKTTSDNLIHVMKDRSFKKTVHALTVLHLQDLPSMEEAAYQKNATVDSFFLPQGDVQIAISIQNHQLMVKNVNLMHV